MIKLLYICLTNLDERALQSLRREKHRCFCATGVFESCYCPFSFRTKISPMTCRSVTTNHTNSSWCTVSIQLLNTKMFDNETESQSVTRWLCFLRAATVPIYCACTGNISLVLSFYGPLSCDMDPFSSSDHKCRFFLALNRRPEWRRHASGRSTSADSLRSLSEWRWTNSKRHTTMQGLWALKYNTWQAHLRKIW